MIKPTIRISKCGYCPKRLSYGMLDYEALPKPSWLETSAREGNLHEQWIKDELRADDIAVYAEQEEVKIECDNFTLVGHIDGKINDHGNEKLLEIKSMSQFEYDRWLKTGFSGFPAYEAQIDCYALATGLYDVQYIVKNRNNGALDPKLFLLGDVKEKVDAIEELLSKLLECVGDGELYPCEYDPNNIECKRCEYRQYCMPAPVVLAEDQEEELMIITDNWRKGDKMVTEGKELVESNKLILAAYTRDTPSHKLLFNNVLTTIFLQHRVTYPKKEVEKLLSEEQLQGIAKVTDIEIVKISKVDKG